jgi:hypothetical protein
MVKNSWWGKSLRILGIVLMGLTAALTIMGGAGTTCVALNPAGFGGTFKGIAPFQWLYILFVLLTTAIGVMGVRAVVILSQGRKNAYRYALIALISGAVVGFVHILVSRALRGGSMPVDMVVYTTLLTLAVFLLIRLPGVWQQVNFDRSTGAGSGGANAAAIAVAASGCLVLTIQFLMAPTHTVAGVNYADVWHTTLSIVGGGLVLSGVGMLLHASLSSLRLRKPEAKSVE